MELITTYHSCLIILGALLLDALLGEAKFWHPLAGFGLWASKLEAWLNQGGGKRLKGLIAWVLLIIPIALLGWWILNRMSAFYLVDGLVLYFAIGAKSLAEHGQRVAHCLEQGDIEAARDEVAKIVSRDVEGMDEEQISRAAVESMLENGNDAVFGALFWFVVAGVPGVLIYRLANTLDAMWGYRTERFNAFGWFSAKMDDWLNWIPARLTAISYALVGNLALALGCWFTQARSWQSSNAGAVMAAGAGSIAVRLGGAVRYHGQVKQRPLLGQGKQAEGQDINRAISLMRRALGLWLLILLVIEGGKSLV